jgi:hypothetical protein
MGVGDRQPFQNIIITILNHEHFSHGTSAFNGNSVSCLHCKESTQSIIGKRKEEKKEVKGHQRGLTKGRKGDLKPILNMKN